MAKEISSYDLMQLIAYGKDDDLLPSEIGGSNLIGCLFKMVRVMARYILEQEAK